MPSKLDEHVKLRLHYAVSTGFLLKDWPSTGRTDWPYQGPPVQIGVQKGLMMTSDEEQIGFVFFLGGPTSTWSLAGFCEKASQIHPNYRVKLKCRHFSWSCLKWTTNPIHCFNRLWRQATCATCATCTYHSCKVWCTWITTLRWKCRQGQGQTRPFNHNLETRCPETRCPGRAKCLAEDIEQFLVKVVPKSWHLLVLTPKLVIDLKRLEHLGLVSYVPEEQRLVIQKCLGWGWEAPPHDRNIDLQDARISWPYHIPHTT
jgi:hypothetical protein